MLEHFYSWEVPAVLTEWRRVLKPGGKLILELPCLNKIFGFVHGCIESGQRIPVRFVMEAIYGGQSERRVEMCHKWGWSLEALRQALEAAGFSRITECEPRYHFPDRDMRFEAIK